MIGDAPVTGREVEYFGERSGVGGGGGELRGSMIAGVVNRFTRTTQLTRKYNASRNVGHCRRVVSVAWLRARAGSTGCGVRGVAGARGRRATAELRWFVAAVSGGSARSLQSRGTALRATRTAQARLLSRRLLARLLTNLRELFESGVESRRPSTRALLALHTCFR